MRDDLIEQASFIEDNSCFPLASSLSICSSGLVNAYLMLAVFIGFHKIEIVYKLFNYMEQRKF